jgi:hypothetical protein
MPVILAPESLSKPFQPDEGGIQKVHAPPKPASPLGVFRLYRTQIVIKLPADLPKQGKTWCDKNVAKCKRERCPIKVGRVLVNGRAEDIHTRR